MRRLGLLLAVPLLTTTLVTGLSVTTAPTAVAACAPTGANAIWKITNVTKSYKPTGLASNWMHPQYEKMTITYSKAATSTWSATVTGTISAEAGVVFAKASSSISVAVGKQWSKSDTWTYSATVPKDPQHQYRLVQKQETRRFKATKFSWSRATCSYSYKLRTGYGEMPRLTASSLVWRLDRRAA